MDVFVTSLKISDKAAYTPPLTKQSSSGSKDLYEGGKKTSVSALVEHSP